MAHVCILRIGAKFPGVEVCERVRTCAVFACVQFMCASVCASRSQYYSARGKCTRSPPTPPRGGGPYPSTACAREFQSALMCVRVRVCLDRIACTGRLAFARLAKVRACVHVYTVYTDVCVRLYVHIHIHTRLYADYRYVHTYIHAYSRNTYICMYM